MGEVRLFAKVLQCVLSVSSHLHKSCIEN